MTAPYRLLADYVSHDTTEAFEQLAIAAKNGDVVGAAVVCFLKGRRYIVNVYGTARRNATLTRGAVMVLGDHVATLIHERDPGETR